METPIILTLIGICVTLFGIIAYHRLTRSRNQEERRINAGKDLVTTFEATKQRIHNYNRHFYELMNFLRQQFEKQRSAAHEFRRHLGLIKGYRFDKAWHKYHGKDDNNPNFIQYEKMSDVQGVLLSRIEEILKFTK